MNSIIRVGRFEIPLANVLSVQYREGAFVRIVHALRPLFALLPAKALAHIGRKVANAPCYDVYLAGGLRVRLNEAEKRQLDDERATDAAVMQVYGMLQSWQQSHGMR